MSSSDVETRNENLAAEVRAELGRRGMSHAELARRLEVRDMYLRRRLKAEVPFGAVELVTVAEILHVPVEQFLRGAA